MDEERSTMALKTTDGFMHHKLKVCVHFPEESPACIPLARVTTMNTSLYFLHYSDKQKIHFVTSFNKAL